MPSDTVSTVTTVKTTTPLKEAGKAFVSAYEKSVIAKRNLNPLKLTYEQCKYAYNAFKKFKNEYVCESAPGLAAPGLGGGEGPFVLMLMGVYEFEGFADHIEDNVVPNIEQIARNIPIFEAAKAYKAARTNNFEE